MTVFNRTEYWPRAGYPLLPAVYRDAWFDEPVPSAVIKRVGLPPGCTFADLDNTVWNHVERPQQMLLVANHILAIVKRRLYFGSDPKVARLPILGYRLPEDAQLDSLPFSRRTLNALRHAGKIRDLEWVSQVTAEEFLSLRSAGARTLLDFATVVEEHYSRDDTEVDASRTATLLRSLELVCDQLCQEFPASSVSPYDPRLGVTGLSSSLGETLAGWRARAQTSALTEIESTLRKVTLLRDELRRLKSQKLEDALQELLRHAATSKYAVALAARLGWDGNGGCTLQEAANLCGVSRERLRQVEKSTLQKLPSGVYLPALDTAIEILADAAAAFEPDVTTTLSKTGLAANAFQPHGVLTAARLLGRNVDLKVSEDGKTVQPVGNLHFAAISEAFKSLANVNYVASVSELQARIDDFGFKGIGEESTRRLLDRHPNTIWLDNSYQWFWLQQATGRNRYVNAARKILSVAQSVNADVLREGVLRHHRSKGMSLPRHVFEGLCRAAGLQRRGQFVFSHDNLDPKQCLASIEAVMFDVLAQNENVLGLHDFRDACVTAGVNRHSFYVYLSYSPIIVRIAPAIWGLRGADVDPTRVSSLLRQAPVSERSLQDHGWTSDGSIWIDYVVSRSVLDSGVVTIPSGVRDIVREGKFELYAVDSARVGTLTIKKSSAWGFAPFISRRGVEIGDHIVVALDGELQMAVIHTGSVDVLESFEDGLGWGPRRLLSSAPASLADNDE